MVGGDPKPQHLERTRVVGVHYKGHRGRHHASIKEKEVKKEPEKPKDFHLWADGPNFDTNLRQNVVALIGRTAYLNCRVFDRGNKTVRHVSVFVKEIQIILWLYQSSLFTVKPVPASSINHLISHVASWLGKKPRYMQ